METDMETEMDMEMEMETDNTRTWIWTGHGIDEHLLSISYGASCPYSAIWNASEIAWRNFQWRYILVAPLQYGKKIIPLLE
jgi:hypothetical protein